MGLARPAAVSKILLTYLLSYFDNLIKFIKSYINHSIETKLIMIPRNSI